MASSRQMQQIHAIADREFHWDIRHLRNFGAKQTPPIDWFGPDNPLTYAKAERLIRALRREQKRRHDAGKEIN